MTDLEIFKIKYFIINYILNKYIKKTFRKSMNFHLNVNFENNVLFSKQYHFSKKDNTINNYKGNIRHDSVNIGSINIINGVISGSLNNIPLLINLNYEKLSLFTYISDKFKEVYNTVINSSNELRYSIDHTNGDVVVYNNNNPIQKLIFT